MKAQIKLLPSNELKLAPATPWRTAQMEEVRGGGSLDEYTVGGGIDRCVCFNVDFMLCQAP